MAEEPERQSEAEPPALPPRPPPRPRQPAPAPPPPPPPRALQHSCWLRKYVFLCTACGGLAVLLGTLFLTVYFMLRSYTSSLNYFETVPTYVPAAMLIVTGLIVMCLAARKNRYGYLIKLCGACCMTCAVLCVVVTISTTVVHMNRLQSLRECVYTQKTQTCTCYSVVLEPVNSDQSEEGVRYVFNATPDCEVIHGALYSCLRAMFGLSVIGILICIFSCMLVYQLLSHEKKKMYWEQLEMRCRYLYHQHRTPRLCGCCEECRYPPPHELFPWEVMDDRFWTPGRIGNLYSPNPGEDGNTVSQRPSSGWSWRRLPWARNSAPQTVRESSSHNYRNTTSSPDSQYGFSSRPDPESYSRRDQPNSSVSSIQVEGYCQRYYMWGPPPPYSNHSSPACREPIFSLLPHQNAGSPLRGHHHHHCQMQRHRRAPDPRCFEELSTTTSAEGIINTNDAGKDIAVENYLDTNVEAAISGDGISEINSNLSTSKDRVSNTLPARRTKKRTDISSVKSVSNIPFSFDQQQKNMKVPQENFSAISNSNAIPRTNVQLLFEPQCVKNSENFPNAKHSIKKICTNESEEIDNRYTQNLSTGPISSRNDNVEGSAMAHYRPCHQDIANSGFEELECVQRNKNEPTESEVYFADVSSCCNVSVRNDGQDSSLYDEVSNPQKHRLMMIALRERTVGYPMSGHVHKLQDMFAEKNHNQNIQAEIIHQNGSTTETRDFHQSSGEAENLHRMRDEGNAASYHSSSDTEQTMNCFSQPRPHSPKNQNSITHLHGKMAADKESSLVENIDDVCHKTIHLTGRNFLDLGNRKPVCNNRIDLTKDSSDHNLSNLSGYPTNENNDSSLVSPMSSVSMSSAHNFSGEPLESCEIFYHPENNSTKEVASDSTSTLSGISKDTFNNYPSPQKAVYEQDTNVQKTKFLLQQQRNNLLNMGCENADFLPLHRNEQLFLAPDAQYETISQSSQVNVPQSYVCNMHPSNFTVSQDGFNGNISTHAALRTNIIHHNVVHDSPVQHGHRFLNLPLHNSNTSENPQTLNNINMSECPYQAATSTEEEETESHNQQSNCYSDATMDSGCHSGSEFPSNRRGGKIISRTVPEDVGVTIVRSVNV